MQTEIEILTQEIAGMFAQSKPVRLWITKDDVGVHLWRRRPRFDREIGAFIGMDSLLLPSRMCAHISGSFCASIVLPEIVLEGG